MARGSTRPARRRLPAKLPMPHTYQHNPHTDRCTSCGTPRSNTVRHLHDHTPDPRDSGTCVRCGLPAHDMRHQDQQVLPDAAMAAAGEYVAA